MQNPSGSRIILLLTPPLFLLLPLSVLVFALERITSALFFAQTARRFSGEQEITVYGPTNSSSDPSSYDYTDVALRVDPAPAAAIVGVTVVAFLVSILGACGIWEMRRVSGTATYERGWSWVTLIFNAIIVGLSIGVLAWASALQGSEKGWTSYEDVGRGQRFTRETWVCSINKLYPRSAWAQPTCGLAKATRFMLITLALAALLTTASMWILVRRRGGANWLFGGKGRYGGFASVYEMNPAAPQPYPQPVPQYYPVYPPQGQLQPQQQPPPVWQANQTPKGTGAPPGVYI